MKTKIIEVDIPPRPSQAERKAALEQAFIDADFADVEIRALAAPSAEATTYRCTCKSTSAQLMSRK